VGFWGGLWNREKKQRVPTEGLPKRAGTFTAASEPRGAGDSGSPKTDRPRRENGVKKTRRPRGALVLQDYGRHRGGGETKKGRERQGRRSLSKGWENRARLVRDSPGIVCRGARKRGFFLIRGRVQNSSEAAHRASHPASERRLARPANSATTRTARALEKSFPRACGGRQGKI